MGVGHTDESPQHVGLGKTLTNFSCTPDGVRTSCLWSFGAWVWCHHVTPKYMTWCTTTQWQRHCWKYITTCLLGFWAFSNFVVCIHDYMYSSIITYENDGWQGGSTGRVSASWSYGFHDQRFEPRPEHKKTLWQFFRAKMLCWLIVGVPNPRVYTHT